MICNPVEQAPERIREHGDLAVRHMLSFQIIAEMLSEICNVKFIIDRDSISARTIEYAFGNLAHPFIEFLFGSQSFLNKRAVQLLACLRVFTSARSKIGNNSLDLGGCGEDVAYPQALLAKADCPFCLSSIHKLKFDVYHEARQSSQLLIGLIGKVVRFQHRKTH